MSSRLKALYQETQNELSAALESESADQAVVADTDIDVYASAGPTEEEIQAEQQAEYEGLQTAETDTAELIQSLESIGAADLEARAMEFARMAFESNLANTGVALESMIDPETYRGGNRALAMNLTIEAMKRQQGNLRAAIESHPAAPGAGVEG